jgi:hypothetical protein
VRALWSLAIAAALALWPPHTYRYATAHRDCAPWDGPAMAIRFSDVPLSPDEERYPYFEIRIYQSPESLAGRTVDLDPATMKTGGAVRCLARGACMLALGGAVHLMPFTLGDTIRGDYDVFFRDSTRERAPFAAAWLPTGIVCG